MKVIPNPIVAYTGEGDRTQYRRILFEKANVQQGGKIIGMFGNLQAVKQPLSFVEVAAHMQGYLDCELIFAVFGRDRGGYEPRMRNLANTYGLGSSLVFMGFQDPVEPWIAACDVVLAPSAGDAFGRTLVEAMLEGVPVVASDAGGHHEIIEQGKNGLLVPVDNPREMAEAVTRLIRDQEFVAQLTACAKQQASNCYSIAKHVKAVSEVYEQVIMAER
ncbi:MAG: hypothetical protein NPIRA02_16440 [Nitrospirales bacterium]|nr:MAG: hypothetical protein NPIRA02_16440 [Nitrospirales bacterium]